MRRFVVMFAVLTLVAAGCSKSKSNESAPGKTQSLKVSVGGYKTDLFNADITAFFPNDLVVHPGDTINFTLDHFVGEPHTVTFGTLADAGVNKINSLGPNATLVQQETSAEMLKLDDVFPHIFSKIQGPPMINQAAAQPCFLDAGNPPGNEPGPKTNPAWLLGGAKACAPATQPAFTGKQSFYNLGMVNEEGKSLSMTLSKDIAPGTYNFICLVHRGGMTAKVTVAAASASADTPSGAIARGQQQFSAIIDKLKPAEEAVNKATISNGVAGAAVPGVFNGLVAEFGPKKATIKSGSTMVWHVFFFHSFSFNAPEDAVGIFIKQPDGTWGFNPKAGPPINSPPPPIQTADFPPPNNAGPVVFNGGTYKGGFLGTGIFGSIPPVLVTYKLKFTKPGTYNLRCQFHPDMKAQVTVI